MASMTANFKQVALQFRRAGRELRKPRAVALESVGIQLLSFIQRDYRAKSEGGADAAGNTWKPTTRPTFENRVRQRAPFKALQRQQRQLAAREKSIRQGPRGSKTKQIETIRRRRAAIRTKKNSLFDKEAATGKTGVDTSLLINSLVNNAPDSIVQTEEFAVVVGTAVKHANFFNEDRSIIPDNFITAGRMATIESTFEEVYDKFAKERLE